MGSSESLFILLLKAALTAYDVSLVRNFDPYEGVETARLAAMHHIQPLILDAAYQCGVKEALPADLIHSSAQLSVLQTQRNTRKLSIYHDLSTQGIPVSFLGGIICRALYIHMDQIGCSEENLVFPAGYLPAIRAYFLNRGYLPEADGAVYADRALQQYFHLYPVEEDTLKINEQVMFKNVSGGMSIDIQRQSVTGLSAAQQVLWLIGTACRIIPSVKTQLMAVCDLSLFIQAFENQIDWKTVRAWCRERELGNTVRDLIMVVNEKLGFDTNQSLIEFSGETGKQSSGLEEETLQEALWDAILYSNGETLDQYNTFEHLSAIRARVQGGSRERLYISGASMTPFLAHRRDSVMLTKQDQPLKAGDIVFYQRKSGQFILHRIYHVEKNEGRLAYDIVGDGQTQIEYNVLPDQIFAVVYEANRKGRVVTPKSFWWRFFQGPWRWIMPMRPLVTKTYTRIRGKSGKQL